MKHICFVLVSLILTTSVSAEIVSCTRDDNSIAGGAASAASGGSQSIMQRLDAERILDKRRYWRLWHK